MDKDLDDLPPEEIADVPTVCGSSVKHHALSSDRAEGRDVFNDDLIDGYIDLKMKKFTIWNILPTQRIPDVLFRVTVTLDNDQSRSLKERLFLIMKNTITLR